MCVQVCRVGTWAQLEGVQFPGQGELMRLELG